MAKKIIPLLVILLILIGLALVKVQRERQTYDITQEMDIKKILPESFAPSEVQKIELYVGAKPQEKVVLSKKEESWILESAFNAPGDKEVIQKFLGQLEKLRGELRSSSKESLKMFDLEQEQALHIKLHGKEKDRLLIHLLAGKKIKDQYNSCFVREAESEQVYRVNEELRSEVGIWGDASDKAPENTYWLEKNILKLNKDEITGISLQYPDKKLVFEKKEKKAEPKEGEKEPSNQEYEWQLTSGGFGKEFKKSELESLLGQVSALRASDVVDPSRKQEWGLEKPAFQLEITLADQKKKTLFAGRPNLTQDGYCSLSDNLELIYKVDSWSFGNEIFRPGSKFFTLPALKLSKSDIKEIELALPAGKVVLSRKETKEKEETKVSWSLVSPPCGLSVMKNIADDLANKLESIEFQDYTDETDENALGFSDSPYRLTVTLKDEGKRVLRCGKSSNSMDGKYASIDEQKPFGAINKYDFNALFPPYDKLFSLDILSFKKIDEVTMGRKEDSFHLKKEDGQWQLTVAGQVQEGNSEAIEKWVSSMASLKARRIAFTQEVKEKAPIATVMFVENGESKTLSIHEKTAESPEYAVVLDNKEVVFWISKETGDSLLQPSSSYLKQEEPKTEDKKEEPKTEDKKEEPKTEDKKEESKTEDKKEEPKTEDKKEEPKTEDKKEEPKTEDKKEEPGQERTEKESH